MVVDAPLLIDAGVTADLARLREDAAKRPVHMPQVMEAIKTKAGRRRHQKAMNALTVTIPGPWTFYVTFSIETGHPAGTCRHMSMSIMRQDRVPHPAGVWMVAEVLGFVGGFETCRVWPEDLSDGGVAINVVQPIAVQPAATA